MDDTGLFCSPLISQTSHLKQLVSTSLYYEGARSPVDLFLVKDNPRCTQQGGLGLPFGLKFLSGGAIVTEKCSSGV